MKKQQMVSVFVLALAAAGMTAGAALAEGKGPHGGKHGGKGARGAAMLLQQFDALDADKDGKVTLAEIEAFRAARFAELDTNGDGGIDRAEMDAFRTRIEAERREARAARAFGYLDRDGDGKISAEELAGPAPGEAKPEGERAQAGKPAAHPGLFFGRGIERLFERADADKDGAVTKAELETLVKERAKEGRGPGGHHGKHDGKHGKRD